MSAHRITCVVATTNPHKLREIEALFSDLPVTFVPMSQVVPAGFSVVEDGNTFEENARKKALAVCEKTMMLTLADDSGLEVDALGGRPGVRSARFAGENATDAENNALLLSLLEEVPDEQRSARFRCVLCLVDPWGKKGTEPHVVSGECTGSIARGTRGSAGFGYDPLFLVDPKRDRSMAELSDEEKNALSHRGNAARKLKPVFEEILLAHIDDVVRIAGRRPSLLPKKP